MSSSRPPRFSGEEPLVKRTKRKKKKNPSSLVLTQTHQQSIPILSLPYDLLLSCIARLSRLHYPSLSLVSKSFRSLLSSPEIYEIRSLINRAESCLYVCINFNREPIPRWFTLCQKPNRKKMKKKSTGNLLIPIAIPNYPRAYRQVVVAVGSSIYAIGGSLSDWPSSSVWVLDCKCNIWREAPSMCVKRSSPAANVFDGKIYVAGGCRAREFNSSNWIEVFDPKTQIWELLLCPVVERCRSSVPKSAVIERKIFYMFGNEGVAYKPEEDRWEVIGVMTYFDLGWPLLSYCVIGNVLFCYSNSDGLEWYDSKIQNWRNVKGLKGLPKFDSFCFVRVADYGGKLAVFWTKYCGCNCKEKRVWCAVIAIERRSNGGDDDGEIWGKVEWVDPLLTIPASCDFVLALAVTV